MIYMKVMQDASETPVYNCSDMPVYILDQNLSDYPDRKGLCHWHNDIEIIYVTKGEMNYHINGKTILLRERSCTIINSQYMHYGSSSYYHDCQFICIRFHPGILNSIPSVYKKYVVPLIENRKIEYLSYEIDSPNHHKIEDAVGQICCIRKEMEDGYELRLISAIYLLWKILFEECGPNLQEEPMLEPGDQTLQKRMVSYIYEHFQDALTLDEISASANISRSKCCMIFKQYLHQSPVDFLNKYRLEVSRRLLVVCPQNIYKNIIICILVLDQCQLLRYLLR